MSHRIQALILAAALTLAPAAGLAQPAPPPASVPTTRIIAIGTVVSGSDPAQVQAILPREVRATAELYLAGKIDQWFSMTGRRGVIFVLNETDPAAARAMLEALPLGQAHLMTFQLTPLGPLGPLRLLVGPPPAP